MPFLITRSSSISSFRVWLMEDWCRASFWLRALVVTLSPCSRLSITLPFSEEETEQTWAWSFYHLRKI